jgi:hypothetical protein
MSFAPARALLARLDDDVERIPRFSWQFSTGVFHVMAAVLLLSLMVTVVKARAQKKKVTATASNTLSIMLSASKKGGSPSVYVLLSMDARHPQFLISGREVRK